MVQIYNTILVAHTYNLLKALNQLITGVKCQQMIFCKHKKIGFGLNVFFLKAK